MIEEKVAVAALEIAKEIALDVGKKGLPILADILVPASWHAYIQKRRLANAQAGLAEIEAALQKYNVKIDYARYFEKNLKIPCLVIENLSTEEEPALRKLLQQLFLKHLSGKFKDDSLYPAFISIIKELSPLEVYILSRIYERLVNQGTWRNIDSLPPLDSQDWAGIADISESSINASLENLARCAIITTDHLDSSVSGGRKGVILGPPLLSSFGVLFLQACIEEIK